MIKRLHTFLRNSLPTDTRKAIADVLARPILALLESSQTVVLGNGISIRDPRRIDGLQFIHVGENTEIGQRVWLSAYEHYRDQDFTPCLVIGPNCYIGNYACITCTSRVSIGEGCVLSEFAYVTDTFHGVDPLAGPILRQPLISKGGVQIGPNTFIGYHACILPGVTLGEHCVVGASSVVTHSFPAYSMIAGSPARLIKKFSFERHDWVAV
jgi:acetyltransferase-like isoleucine patch superfamily enzyme